MSRGFAPVLSQTTYTPFDVGIQLRIGEFEFYIFNTTCLDVLEVDLRI
jgi:hypothetical protein